jgi:hypothetical protein
MPCCNVWYGMVWYDDTEYDMISIGVQNAFHIVERNCGAHPERVVSTPPYVMSHSLFICLSVHSSLS